MMWYYWFAIGIVLSEIFYVLILRLSGLNKKQTKYSWVFFKIFALLFGGIVADIARRISLEPKKELIEFAKVSGAVFGFILFLYLNYRLAILVSKK